VHEPVAHGVGERVVEVQRRRVADLLGAGVANVAGDGRPEVGVALHLPEAAVGRAFGYRDRSLEPRGDRHGMS